MQPAFAKQKAKFVSDHQLDLKIGKMLSEMQAPERNAAEELRSNTQYRDSINGVQSQMMQSQVSNQRKSIHAQVAAVHDL